MEGKIIQVREIGNSFLKKIENHKNETKKIKYGNLQNNWPKQPLYLGIEEKKSNMWWNKIHHFSQKCDICKKKKQF